MQFEIKRLQRELKITSIFVTHDQAEALSMADRVCVLDQGVVQQVGAPEDIYHRPANGFVAGFIGRSNRLRGRVEAIEGEATRVRLPDGATLAQRGQPRRNWRRRRHHRAPARRCASRAMAPTPPASSARIVMRSFSRRAGRTRRASRRRGRADRGRREADRRTPICRSARWFASRWIRIACSLRRARPDHGEAPRPLGYLPHHAARGS